MTPPATSAELAPTTFRRSLWRLRLVDRWFRAQLIGSHNVPRGPALIVSNHGTLGYDLPALIHQIYRATGRPLRSLGDHVVFQAPGIARWATEMGIVDGTPANAEALLRAGQLVLVYPGGAREAMPEPHERYQLFWDHAHGFARLAARLDVPVVPLAGIGVDDVYTQRISRKEMGDTALGRFVKRRFGERYLFPIYSGIGPLPRRVGIRYVVGEAIDPTTIEEENLSERSRVLHHLAQSQLEGLIDREMSTGRQSVATTSTA